MAVAAVLSLTLAGGIRAADWSLQFNGSSQYATFGAATATLGASNFTLECWFKRTGAGATTTTGTGGITAVPLVTKGRGEADGDNRDCNYFLGITSANVLGADFEEGAGKTSPGLNHPISGSTVIVNDRWYHAAVTFDGTTWRLYLDGILDGTLTLGANRGPRNDSIQHAAIASALTSTGTAAGFFAGRMDEVRIWNVARNQTDILASMRAKVPTATGLLGRWSLDEGTGTTIASSAGTTVNGTLMATPSWNIDSPFAVVAANSVWKYLDNGSDQGTAWRAPGFNDTTWASGPAELGYGDGGEATVLGYGSDANNKYPTTYFRQTFHVTGGSSYSGLDVSLVRDDGAIVYLNGAEIWRANMPTGDVLYNTYAASPEVSGTDESKWFNTTVPTVALVEGANVLAVEIHQQRAASSDISFNLKLAASRTDTPNTPPVVSLTAPTGAALLPTGTPASVSASAFDDGSVAKVEFFANGVKLGETLASPFDFAWTPATPGRVALTAKATDNLGAITTSAAVNVTVYEAGTGALQFDGVNDHVTFGQTVSLGASNLTIECWMRKLGTGLTSSSGNGGIVAVPLVTKGRGEAENSNVDCNYFFGILPSGALAADFEQFYADGAAAGQNYPVSGTSTAAGDGAWHHVAVTYDGSTWVLYLDGVVDKTLTIGNHTPRFDSIQHAGIGVAMTSTGATEGAFEGAIDEVRIWNYARAAQQISDNRDKRIMAASGLLGHWSLDDASGTIASNSITGQPVGTLVNAPLWCLGRSLTPASNTAPIVTLTAPTNGAHLDTSSTISLTASAYDDGSVVGVEFFLDDVSLGTDSTSPYGVAWTDIPTGSYALKAVAIDDTGLVTTSGVANVSVTMPNLPPVVSALLPTNGATGITNAPTLDVTVSDREGAPLTVSFYGRPVGATQPVGADFTIAVLPDTQFYSQDYPAIFSNQTAWIVANRTSQNIAYVSHLGDVTDKADSQMYQWTNAASAMYLLEDPVITGLPNGIPYGIAPGNHDHVGGTIGYNQYFGVSHFTGKPWYGGHMGTDNQNHYDLISAGGMDFIVLYTDWNYASLSYPPIDAWANSVLQAYPNRRAILVRHAILESSGAWADDGLNFFNTVKTNANVFLLMNGHSAGERQYTETVNGRRVDVLCADYQNYANGGNGYLRLYQFSPSNNVIRVKTYSTTLGLYETDANSQFDIPYTMGATPAPYQLLSSASGITSGNHATAVWTNLADNAAYQWYATVSDGTNTASGATNLFTTAAIAAPVVQLSNPYSDINWGTVSAFKGNLHTHTTNSDGNQAPSEVLDGYQAQNYDFLAVTDHNFVTYPWTSYGRDPLVVGMTDISGNELSSGHHTVSLFSGYASSSADQTTLLSGVATAGGLSFFAHPGRYSETAQWYADHYLAQPTCIGQEIYNQGDRYTGDRVKWDQVLSILMPARPVWGFSNDDSHQASHIGLNRTYLLLPSLSATSVRAALEEGQFYATYSTSAAAVPPAFTNIAVDAMAGTVTVRGTGYTQVRWISQGTQVATGETLDLVATPGVAKYVRAELHGSGGIAYSNPFGIVLTGGGSTTNRPPTVSITSPSHGATVTATFMITADATDDGTITNLAFYADGSLLGNDTTATFNWTWFNAAVGSHALTAVAWDNNGVATTSAVVNVTVAGGASPGIDFAENFNGMGTGTALPAGWSFLNQASGSPNDKTLWTVANPIVQTGVTMNPVTPLTLNDAPNATSNNGFNALGASGQTGDRCIATSPTGIASLGIQAPPLTNTTGAEISTFTISYDIKRFTAGSGGADELPGYWLFYSVNNGTTWYNVTALNPTVANVPNTAGLSSLSATNVVLSAPWVSGGTLLLRWIDDNGIPSSPDQINGLDNVRLTAGTSAIGATPPLVAITSPINNASTDTNFTITVTATDDGTVTNVAFLADGGLLGSDASAPYSITWNGASMGAHALTALAWDNDGLVTTSAVVNITVALQTPPGISFGPSGTGTQTFDALPAATQWATASVGTGNTTYTTPNQLDAAVGTLAVSSIASTLVSDTVAMPAKNALDVWSSYGGGFIQTCPTSIGATLLKATLVNQSGSDVAALRLAYQYTVAANVTEEVPGQRVFYSLTGAVGSWTAISELSGVTSSTIFDVTVALTSPWASGATLYLLWADDNDTANSPDTYFQIDNFSASPSGPLPFGVALTAPANGQSFASGATIAMQAVTSGVSTATVTGLLFRADGVAVGNDPTAPYTFSWANAATGTYALDAVALLDNGSAVTSTAVSVTLNAPVNQPPAVAVIAPTNHATTVSLSPALTVSVSDPESSSLSVAFYGRAVTNAPAGPDFALVVLPDTQNYSTSYPLVFESQTDWIVANRLSRNIAYVAHVGDIVNTSSSHAEYQNATNALYRLENPATTGLPDGIPYGTSVGNHDIATTLYNQYFGVNHFAGRSYYGGNYGSNNDSHYDLFSASGLDFIVLHLTYGGGSDVGLMAWANSVLQTYANRRAIVVSHSILNVTTRPTPSTWTGQGQAIFDGLKANTNLFLMLCGHMHGEGFRREVQPDGRVIDILLADYQDYPNGGDGNLRLMTFSPSNNQVRVTTTSTSTGVSRTGSDSQFNLDYTLSGPAIPFVALGTNTGVSSGTQTTFNWSGLTTNTTYEWYATISDGTNRVTGASASFTTRSDLPVVHTLTATAGANGTVTPASVQVEQGGSTNFTIAAASYYHIADVRTNNVSIGGPFGMSSLVYTWIGITADGTLTADFAQNLTPSGTPEAWLAQHGLTVGEENLDSDGDGMKARDEYVAGTSPTNANSVLKITGLGLNGSTPEFNLRWPSVAGRVYDVEHSTNLTDVLSFQPLLTDIKATPSTNSCAVPLFPDRQHFFRVKVRLAP